MTKRVYLDEEKKVILLPREHEAKYYEGIAQLNSERAFGNAAKAVIDDIFDFKMTLLVEDLFNMGFRFSSERDEMMFTLSIELARAALHRNEGYDHKLWEVLNQLVPEEEEEETE